MQKFDFYCILSTCSRYINDLDHSTYTPLASSKSVHKFYGPTIKCKPVEYEVIIIFFFLRVKDTKSHVFQWRPV